MPAEDGGEVGEVREADGVGHLGDVQLLLAQQTGGLLQADVTQELAGGDAGHLLHLAVELCTADAYLLGEHIDVEVAVGEVLVDGLHDTFHEQLVVALDIGRLDLVGLLLGAAVLALQTLSRAQQVVDVHAELLHVEGLGEESVGAALEALETVADIGHGGEHDDGYIADIDVGLDHAEHGEAVHLGHHDVADDEVVALSVDAGEKLLQSLTAVMADVEAVVASELVADVGTNLFVVVDEEDAVAVAGGLLGGGL